jgi:hypothetical protein
MEALMGGVLRMLLFAVVAATALLALPVRADPPDRVGRISLLSGDVEFRNAVDGDGEDAVVNWPVTSGNVVATGRLARAEVRIGSTAVRLEEGTELEFARLDDQSLQLRLTKGTVAVRMKNSQHAADFELTTPQGRLSLREPGRYRFESDLVDDTTSVAVFQGGARFEGPNSAITVKSGQRLEVYGIGEQRLQTSAAEPDEFDEWSLARDHRDQSARALRFVSNEMTGYEDLDEHGDWRDSPEYGAVWYPRSLPSGWAPYRWGRWAWVDPWGWTWVDDMPWGFAPFHYGRWALVGNTWAWVPGRAAMRPVYAPALVAWVGQPGWRVSFNLGSVSAVGWFPLAPREVYYPAYPCSTRYVRNVNVAHVVNVVHITDARPADVTRVKYLYRGAPQAVTVVATDAVARGRRVHKEVVAMKDVRSLAAQPVAIAAPAVTPVPRPLRARASAQAAAAKGATSPIAPVGSPPGNEKGGAEARHGLRRGAGGQPDQEPERDKPAPRDRAVVTNPARPVDEARDAPRDARERPMPRTESHKAMPADHGVAPRQPRPRDAARQSERVPDSDRRLPEPSPPNTGQVREHGMRRDRVRDAEPSPVRAMPTAPVRSEPSGPKRDDTHARPERRRPQQESTPSAPPGPRSRPLPPAMPQRPAAVPEQPQRGVDAVQAQERARRHDGQWGVSGMGGRESHSPAEAGKHRESGNRHGPPEPAPGAARM